MGVSPRSKSVCVRWRSAGGCIGPPWRGCRRGLQRRFYPNVILVPLTEDERLAIPELSLTIDPTPENGCSKRCWALAHCVATTSAARMRPTTSRVTSGQLRAIRRQIALAIGLS
jgi:mRNA interferase MazF